ncbi:MAG: exopolysaccharide biosynthesis polyprenyl glycosylphosphotransferase [Candidatus Krumholzibacteriia bacterium]|jgi:exopolysaccharide biosynthesis polyprenyl glycosylphosphotransferase
MAVENYYLTDAAFVEFVSSGDGKNLSEPNAINRFFKRLFDVMASSFGLFLILPLFPFIFLLIRLESRGPIFFKQSRVGYRGRMFDCYKFRSMAIDAEDRKEEFSHLNEATGAAFKIKDDPRITGVGRFLRRSSLDEFPQLYNVLLGEMSIVGPRPQIPSEVADYSASHATRLLVKPGLTCLWQVSGRSHLEFEEWMKLDYEYVERAGLWFDIQILLKTLPAVIERKGAY